MEDCLIESCSTREYLNQHYLTQRQLAATCSISSSQLQGLISDRMVPEASYVATGKGVIISKVFGGLTSTAMAPEKYFHPANAGWVKAALSVQSSSSRLTNAAAHQFIKARFKRNFATALSKLNATTYRLADSFTESGDAIDVGLDIRTETAWGHFCKGVFSLCVADPSSEYRIAKKEILQEALTHVDQQFSKSQGLVQDKHHTLMLISLYERESMPFSPLEYPQSSRKRLVEDLRAKLESQL